GWQPSTKWPWASLPARGRRPSRGSRSKEQANSCAKWRTSPGARSRRASRCCSSTCCRACCCAPPDFGMRKQGQDFFGVRRSPPLWLFSSFRRSEKENPKAAETAALQIRDEKRKDESGGDRRTPKKTPLAKIEKSKGAS